MRKAISEHKAEVSLEAVFVDDKNPGERIYSLIVRDPDFITSDVAGEVYIRVAVQLQKVVEEDRPYLLIDTEAFFTHE